MSAGGNFRLDAAYLIKDADRYEACQDFHVNDGESRQHCAGCGLTLTAHVVVAQRERLKQACGTCAHANLDDYDDAGLVGCTLSGGFHQGQAMQVTSRCAAWVAR